MNSKIVMGVRVDKLPPAEALGKAREFLRTGGQHKIFTPNPEMLVKANKDDGFVRAFDIHAALHDGETLAGRKSEIFQ